MFELIKQVQQGDYNSFEQIAHRYTNLVKTVCSNYYLAGGDYDDLYQEGLIALFIAVQSYSPEHNVTFETFARKVVKRKLISAVRQSRRRKHEYLNQSVSLYSEKYQNIPILDTIRDSRYQDLIRDIEQPFSMDEFLDQFSFTPLEKEILLLYLEGFSYENIVNKTNRNFKSVDNAMQRIRRKIKKYYQKYKMAI